MNIPHKRYSDEAKGWVDCDGNAVDIGTMVAPHRHLCVKCRKVFTGYAVDAETNEVVGYVDEAGKVNVDPTPEPGRLARLWKVISRWIW